MNVSTSRIDAAFPMTEPDTPATDLSPIEPMPDHAEQDAAPTLDDVTPGRGYDMLPMVGLGGSAGSIPALQAFFAAMSPDSGMAFVVVLHLAADRESALDVVLQRSTAMPVRRVTDWAAVEANHVYVIPPGKVIQSANGRLHCVDLKPESGRRVAVDLFFRTLADTHGPRASAVVLSGADGDGAIGIKRIKERGGLTIAQDPQEAEFESMPRSAIDTGMVDWVLPAAEMPERLRSYHALLPRLKLPPEHGAPLSRGEPPTADDLEPTLRELLAYVRSQTGRDFVNYKRATVLRRVARRMSVNGVEDLDSYLGFVRTHPGEAGALLKDLLISVTNFFRDRHTFDALESNLPRLFDGKGGDNSIRVWVAGCATGEEAYTIAILLSEHARTLKDPPALQIFATDLDEDAIRIAREGIYPHAITADLSDERLRRFFTREVRGYRVRSDLRETVLFAVHDLLRDSPFSRIDLVSCRNLLIYLNNAAQLRALETAHFSLRAGGLLFLGASETVAKAPLLFAAVDEKHRLYESRLLTGKSLAAPGGQSTLAHALNLQERSRQPAALPPPGIAHHALATPWLRPSPGEAGVRSWRELHLKLIERFAPASLVVDDEQEIVHLSAGAGRFLHFSGGEPTSNLLTAVHPALSVGLRTALVRARSTDQPVTTKPISFAEGDQAATVVITVARADDIVAGYLLVTFESHPVEGKSKVEPAQPPAADDEMLRMARQIDELKWLLRDVSDRGDSTTQELKVKNEELQAINEQLRSATEEIETSREELQSIKEELTTVSVELKSNVEELGRSNADLQNLMASTAIATVFLDRSMRITLFTPSAVALFNLIASDVGRPLSDLSHRLDYPEMQADARRVLSALAPVEREVGFEEKSYLVRALPYRGAEDRIAGVVFTFLDITSRKKTKETLHESELVFRTIVSQSAAGVAYLDLEGRLTLVNPRYCAITGHAESELLGRHAIDFVHPDDRAQDRALFDRLVEDGQPFEIQKRYCRGDGKFVWVRAAVTATDDLHGKRSAVIVVVLDITESRRTDRALRQSEERFRLLLQNAREFAIVGMDLDRVVTSWNLGAERLLGYTEGEIIGKTADVIFTDEDRAAGVPAREGATALAEGRAVDERWHMRRDGSRFWGSGAMMSMREERGAAFGLLKIFRDQSASRQAHEALENSRTELVEALVENRRARAETEVALQAKTRFLAILSHELRTPLTPVVMALHALDRTPDLPAAARGTLDLIRRNVKAELHLIDDLLDVTRIASGKLELSVATADMHDVIRAAADVCEADFAAKRQRLRLTLGAPRPAVPGDAQRLQQVVWNLLKNASKFTPVGGDIRIETRNQGPRFVFSVADSGIGIDASAITSIFEAFQQEGDWVTTEFGGLGLGLAIAKATVEAHYGGITVQSAGRNRGATFVVELPTHRDPA